MANITSQALPSGLTPGFPTVSDHARSVRPETATGTASKLDPQARPEPSEDPEQKKARDAARQFESLLLHSMLKTMRKTTLSENTTNQRAIYNDMLDQQMANTLVEAGGIGIADQLMTQLLQKPSGADDRSDMPGEKALATQAQIQLRSLLKDDDTNRPTESVSVSQAANDDQPLRFAKQLWGTQQQAVATTRQRQFIEPLLPYARQSAERIGTSANAVLAVAALETGWGRFMIKDEQGEVTHNYFGIKAVGSDSQYTQNTTTEFVNGKSEQVLARFKSFNDPADGMHGFADFILENPRYSNALSHAHDPERFLTEIHKAGYATDPDYASKAIAILNQIERKAPKL
ncbi:MAG: flagellar assembly peptidoglycan hydrolase FlgJ [Granulosicoccus sp.]